MCIYHITIALVARYRGPNGGPGHKLITYRNALIILGSIIIGLFVTSWIMQSEKEYNQAHISTRAAGVPAIIGGVFLLVMLIEVFLLFPDIAGLWRQNNITLLYSRQSAMSATGTADVLDVSEEMIEEAELAEAQRTYREMANTDPADGPGSVPEAISGDDDDSTSGE